MEYGSHLDSAKSTRQRKVSVPLNILKMQMSKRMLRSTKSEKLLKGVAHTKSNSPNRSFNRFEMLPTEPIYGNTDNIEDNSGRYDISMDNLNIFGAKASQIPTKTCSSTKLDTNRSPDSSSLAWQRRSCPAGLKMNLKQHLSLQKNQRPLTKHSNDSRRQSVSTFVDKTHILAQNSVIKLKASTSVNSLYNSRSAFVKSQRVLRRNIG